MEKYIPYIGVAVAIASFLYSHVTTRDSANMRADIEVLKKQMAVFWGAVESNVTKILHSPTHVERDLLLEKVQRGEQLSDDETVTLKEMLLEIIEGREPQNRSAAVMLLGVLEVREINQRKIEC